MGVTISSVEMSLSIRMRVISNSKLRSLTHGPDKPSFIPGTNTKILSVDACVYGFYLRFSNNAFSKASWSEARISSFPRSSSTIFSARTVKEFSSRSNSTAAADVQSKHDII